MNQKEPSNGKMVGALVGGLRVLRYLADAKRPVGVTQVARDLKMNASTCFNILKTLVQEDLIAFNADDKTYEFGPGILALLKGAIDSDVNRRLIRPHLEQLAHDHRVTVTLFQRLGENRMILVDRAESDSEIRVHMGIGQRMPLLGGAFGRCMAAFLHLSPDEIAERFKAVRWQNPPSLAEYIEDVEEARTNGYAVDRDKFVVGVTIVAAPILNAQGKPTMVISAVGLSGQFPSRSVDALAHDMRSRARKLSDFPARDAA